MEEEGAWKNKGADVAYHQEPMDCSERPDTPLIATHECSSTGDECSSDINPVELAGFMHATRGAARDAIMSGDCVCAAFSVGTAWCQGSREAMEDAHTVDLAVERGCESGGTQPALPAALHRASSSRPCEARDGSAASGDSSTQLRSGAIVSPSVLRPGPGGLGGHGGAAYAPASSSAPGPPGWPSAHHPATAPGPPGWPSAGQPTAGFFVRGQPPTATGHPVGSLPSSSGGSLLGAAAAVLMRGGSDGHAVGGVFDGGGGGGGSGGGGNPQASTSSAGLADAMRPAAAAAAAAETASKSGTRVVEPTGLVSLFAVFDGHGGADVARFAARNVGRVLCLASAFEAGRGDLRASVTEAFLILDEAVIKHTSSNMGACATVALLRGNELVVAGVGDARCVLCRGTTALPLTTDHKPTDEREAARIIAAGGYVVMGRVNACLNVSRALGDAHFKQAVGLPAISQQVSAEPDVSVATLTSEDAFMVVACDGVWNAMGDQEAIDFVGNRLARGCSASAAAHELVEYCLTPLMSAYDNVTALVVVFRGQGQRHFAQ
ncbi:hypothetical protein FOA52_003540 [Chlamydomonas sp. UWO 241]|nr:hypothetical protein FOA52_003540 [Chlamydomonas sp. UWO 241]